MNWGAVWGLLPAVLLAGCAGMVTSNTGDRVTIEHDGFISLESVQEQAVKACVQNGRAGARHIHSANKNPRLEKGFGVQLSTFECF